MTLLKIFHLLQNLSSLISNQSHSGKKLWVCNMKASTLKLGYDTMTTKNNEIKTWINIYWVLEYIEAYYSIFYVTRE